MSIQANQKVSPDSRNPSISFFTPFKPPASSYSHKVIAACSREQQHQMENQRSIQSSVNPNQQQLHGLSLNQNQQGKWQQAVSHSDKICNKKQSQFNLYSQNQQIFYEEKMFTDLDELLFKISSVTNDYKHDKNKQSFNQGIQNGKSSQLSIQTNLSRSKEDIQSTSLQNQSTSDSLTLIKQQSQTSISQPITQNSQNTVKHIKIHSLFSGRVRQVACSQIFDSQQTIHNNNNSMLSQSTLQIRDFNLGRILGGGTFGDVMVCQHKATHSIYALKTMLKSTILNEKMVPQFILQLKINYMVSHPNIVKLYTHFQDECHVFLLLQYADCHTLTNYLKREEEFVARVIAQVLNGVEMLHGVHIAHRDIKPENVVVFFDSVVKLCDFGWAAIVDPNVMKKTFCGTLEYVSPEMKDEGVYSKEVDLWSVGVLTYELLTGVSPLKEEIKKWKNKGGKKKEKWSWKVDYPYFITPLAKEFMKKMMKENPLERGNMKYAKGNLFLTLYREKINQEIRDIQELLE